MKKTRIFKIFSAIALVLIFSSCSANKADKGTKENPIIWRAAHFQPADHHWQLSFEEFKKNVEKETDGRVKIEIYPNGQLGSEEEILNGIAAGTVDMTLSAESMSSFEPAANLMAAPFLYDSEDEIIKIMETDPGKKIDEKLEENNFKPLMYQFRTPRNLTSNKLIRNADDARGIKIRLPNAPLSITSWSALGANTIVMGLNDTFTALSQGVVNSQENPYDLIYNSSFYEVQKYVMETEHVFGYLYFVVGNKQFESLDSELQEKILKAADETQKWINDYYFRTRDDYKKLIEETGKMEIISDVDRDSFREKMVPAVIDYFDEDTSELYYEIEEELETIREEK